MITLKTNLKSLYQGLWIMLGLWIISVNANAVTIQVTLDREKISLNETVNLIYTVKQQPAGEPDFSPLQNDFEILHRGNSSSTQILQGQVNRSISWKLVLRPKRQGKLQIPIIHFGSDKTTPLTLEVTKMPTGTIAKAGKAIFLEVELSPKTPYVQAQMLYIVRLLYATKIRGELSPPRIQSGKALIEPLGKDIQYQTQRNKRHYNVLERRYALFPQQSGSLSLAPILFEGILPSKNPQRYDFLGSSGTPIRQFSQSLSVNVETQPESTKGQFWLPANDISLHVSWSIEPKQLKVGEPVTLTLALIADGLKAEQLTPLSPILPQGLKSYTDKPSLRNEINKQGIIGLYEQKIVLVPTHSGEFKFPAINIPWWNIKTKQMETTTLKARQLVIAKSSNAIVPSTTDQTQNLALETASSEKQSLSSITSTHTKEKTIESPDNNTLLSNVWFYISIVFAILWLLSLLITYQLKPDFILNKKTISNNDAHNKRITSEKKIRAKLLKACTENDAIKVKKELQKWGEVLFNQPILSLHQLSSFFDGNLQKNIIQLNNHLYSHKSSEFLIRLNDLKTAIEAHSTPKKTINTTIKAMIPPLHKI